MAIRNYWACLFAVMPAFAAARISFDAPRAFLLDKPPNSVAAGDFNGDGKPDVAVASYKGVAILLGNGDGTFGSPKEVPVSGLPHSVAVADFNGDGKLDVVVADEKSNSVSILLGRGDGTLKRQ
jgi:hypothetical protein